MMFFDGGDRKNYVELICEASFDNVVRRKSNVSRRFLSIAFSIDTRIANSQIGEISYYAA